MLATIVMCTILSACQNTNAATKQTAEYSSNDHHIQIHSHDNQRYYRIDGKEFTYDELSSDQKRKITKLEKELEQFEINIELDSEQMERWAEEMEQVADKMEIKVQKLEDAMSDAELDFGSLEEFSEKMTRFSRNMNIEMTALEEQMKKVEHNMPKFDQQNISELEAKAKKLETLLIEIAETM